LVEHDPSTDGSGARALTIPEECQDADQKRQHSSPACPDIIVRISRS